MSIPEGMPAPVGGQPSPKQVSSQKPKQEEVSKTRVCPFGAGLMITHEEQAATINELAKEILTLGVFEEKSLTPAQKESLSHIITVKSELNAIKESLASPNLSQADSMKILQRQATLHDKIEVLKQEREQIVSNPRLVSLKAVQTAISSAKNEQAALVIKYQSRQENLLKENKKMLAAPMIEECLSRMEEKIKILETTEKSLKEVNIDQEVFQFAFNETQEGIARLKDEIKMLIDESATKKLSVTTILQKSVKNVFASKKEEPASFTTFLPSLSSRSIAEAKVGSNWGVNAKQRGHILNEISETEKSFSNGIQEAVNLLGEMASDKKLMGNKKDAKQVGNTKVAKQVSEMLSIYETTNVVAKALSMEFAAINENKQLTDQEKILKLAELYSSPLFQRYASLLEVCAKRYNPTIRERLVNKFLKGRVPVEGETPFGVRLGNEMIKPIQRMPRHKLLITDLLKSVPEGTQEHKNLSIALRHVTGLADLMNAQTKGI